MRLRAYRDGEVREYQGERPQLRFPDTTSPFTRVGEPQGDGTPQLRNGGNPAFEPAPLVTVDRLLRVRVEPDSVKSATVVLRGACAGTMARLRFDDLATCVDTDGVLVPLAPLSLAAGKGTPPTSLAGAFGAELATDCPSPPNQEEICVRGGAFIFGSADYFDGSDNDNLPRRIVRVRSFLMDKHEVSVGRYRAALASGFPGSVSVNDGVFDGAFENSCAYTSAPGEREDFPVNCVSSIDAAAFCALEGKSLPSEVEWEYAATAGGRAHKAHYPWEIVRPRARTSSSRVRQWPTTSAIRSSGEGRRRSLPPSETCPRSASSGSRVRSRSSPATPSLVWTRRAGWLRRWTTRAASSRTRSSRFAEGRGRTS